MGSWRLRFELSRLDVLKHQQDECTHPRNEQSIALSQADFTLLLKTLEWYLFPMQLNGRIKGREKNISGRYSASGRPLILFPV